MVRRVLLLVVVAGLFTVGPIMGARAVTTQTTTCNADLTATFDPGLTLMERDQKVRGSGALSGCTGGVVTDGTLISRGRAHASCTSGTATAGVQVRWNTGQISRIRVDVDITNGLVQGTVVQGLFAGEPVTGSLTIEPINGDCVFRPVTKARATGTITIG